MAQKSYIITKKSKLYLQRSFFTIEKIVSVFPGVLTPELKSKNL